MIWFLSSIALMFTLEPFVINFIYFSNIDWFLDLILTKKNRDKLIAYFKNK